MPCRDWDDADRIVEVFRDRPETVRQLCDALRTLEQNNITVPKSCEAWWKAHKKEDALRIAAEKAKLERAAKKKAILSKLSDEEKKILGL